MTDPHVNPQTGVWDDNYYANLNKGSGGGGGGGGGGYSIDDLIKSAQALNQFQIQQNAPAIASQQASIAPLQQRYNDLLAGIKQNQTVAENRQTLTTNNELGKRGITGSSGLAQQEITNAVNPITQQYTQMGAQTTDTENTDIANINNAIASLQAGNPASSISSASGLLQAQQSANEFNQQMAATQRQNDITNALNQQKYQSSLPATVAAPAAVSSSIVNTGNSGLTTGGYSSAGLQYSADGNWVWNSKTNSWVAAR